MDYLIYAIANRNEATAALMLDKFLRRQTGVKRRLVEMLELQKAAPRVETVIVDGIKDFLDFHNSHSGGGSRTKVVQNAVDAVKCAMVFSLKHAHPQVFDNDPDTRDVYDGIPYHSIANA